MDLRGRIGIVAGLFAIALSGPIIFFDYVVPGSSWAHAHPSLYALVFASYILRDVAYMLFIYAISALAQKQRDHWVPVLAYLLITAHAATVMLALFVLNSGANELGQLVDHPLVWIRASLTVLLGLAILFSKTTGSRARMALGACALIAGIAILSELSHGSLDDFADLAFLLAGITFFALSTG